MQKINSRIWAITLIIVGLMLTSTSVAVTMKEKNDMGTIVISTYSTCTPIVESFNKQKNPYEQFSISNEHFLGIDYPVFSLLEYYSQNPGIATDESGDILVLAEVPEDYSSTTLFGRWSTDNGISWVDYEEVVGWEIPDNCEKPKLDYYGKGKTVWGTMTPGMQDGTAYYIEFPDMTDPEVPSAGADGWVIWSVDWSEYGIECFDSTDVSCYSDESNIPSSDFFGIIGLTGDWDNYEDTLIFSYFTSDGGVTIRTFGDVDCECSNVATAIDKSTGRFFIIVEYKDHGEGYTDGFWVLYHDITSSEDWANGGWPGYIFEGLSNPDVIAKDGSVYIVGEFDNGEEKDIVCFSSSNGGEDFSSSIITETMENEVFPQVSIADGDAICSYVSGNNLYSSIFEGLSWDSPEQVNDEEGSVVEQHCGMSMAGPFVAWTDNRVLPYAIYFDNAMDTDFPIIEIGSISGGMGVSAIIKNTGTGDASEVSYSITATGGMLGLINQADEGTLSIPAGSETTISLPMIMGLGKVTISITAASASTDVEGIQLLIFTMI